MTIDEWYAGLRGAPVARTVAPVMDFLFPHPVVPRNNLTVAEQAFMREVRRRVGLLVPDFTSGIINISDVPGEKDDDLLYQLTVRWDWPPGSVRGDGVPARKVINGVGTTPGEALEAVLRAIG